MKTLTNNNLRLILIITVILTTVKPSFAQEDSKGGKHYGGYGYFQIGYQIMNLSALNDALIENGYPDLQNGSISIGGGGHYLLSNLIIGGEGYGLPGSNSENGSYNVSQSGGYGFFNLGYSLLRTPSLSLAPVIGIGGGGMTVTLREKEAHTTSFEDILDDPGRESSLNQGGFMLNFSLLAHYMVLGNKSSDSSSGFLVGLKVGYILNLDEDNWYLGEQKLTQAPASSMSGFYASLVIGGGSSRRY